MTSCRFSVFVFSLLVLWSAAFGCARSEGQAESSRDGPPPATVPVVDDARTDLILTWSTPDGPGVANRVADVPKEYSGRVRVQDPTIPAESKDPGWIFVADLTQLDAAGRYRVRPVKRDEYDRALAAQRGSASASSPSVSPSASEPLTPDTVLMYSTKHCPVCKKARRWLLDNGIPYVEKDIESDGGAAADLQRKGAAQGIPTNGVPVFEVRGKLLPGFDPSAILRVLRGGTAFLRSTETASAVSDMYV